MHSEQLADALGRAELPESAQALERTVAAARELAERSRRPERPRRRVSAGRRALAFAVVAALITAFMTLTPPGRATAEWIEDLIGLSGPSRETLGTGTSPAGRDYEVRAQIDRSGEDEACLVFEWTSRPTQERSIRAFGSCEGGLRARGAIDVPFAGKTEEGDVAIVALTNLELAEARFEYSTEPDSEPVQEPARTFTLDAKRLASMGAPRSITSATFAVGFLPGDVGEVGSESSAQLELVDAAGETIAQTPVAWLKVGPGAPAGYLTSCGSSFSPARSACRAAMDPELRLRQLYRNLAAPEPPPDLIERAAAAGTEIVPASRADLLSLPPANATFDPLTEAIGKAGAAGAAVGAAGAAARDIDIYVIRTVPEDRLAIALRVTFHGRPGEPQALVLVDARTGERLTTAALGSAP